MGSGAVSRYRAFYIPESFRGTWEKFLEISRREGKNASVLIREFVSEYVDMHAPGNPQTVMNSFAPDGSITRDNIEGRIRQLALEESRKLGKGEINYMRIMEFVKSEGIQGKAAVAMSERTAIWLFKAMKVKVWR